MRFLAAIALTLPTLSATPALAETNYEGEFVTHCLPTATCFFNVSAQGGGRYLVEWRATDRTGQRTHCEVSAVLSRGPAEVRPGEVFEEAISTKLPNGDKLIVADMGDQAFMWTGGSTCEKAVDKGYIGMNGFYDRFIGDE